jgi:hypothetical protein
MKVELKNKRNKILLNEKINVAVRLSTIDTFDYCQFGFMKEIRQIFRFSPFHWALKFLKEQNDRICLNTVLMLPASLEFVKNQTDEICLAAVRSDGLSLQYVRNQTDEICLAAVKTTRYALQFVKKQNDEINRYVFNKIYFHNTKPRIKLFYN